MAMSAIGAATPIVIALAVALPRAVPFTTLPPLAFPLTISLPSAIFPTLFPVLHIPVTIIPVASAVFLLF